MRPLSLLAGLCVLSLSACAATTDDAGESSAAATGDSAKAPPLRAGVYEQTEFNVLGRLTIHEVTREAVVFSLVSSQQLDGKKPAKIDHKTAKLNGAGEAQFKEKDCDLTIQQSDSNEHGVFVSTPNGCRGSEPLALQGFFPRSEFVVGEGKYLAPGGRADVLSIANFSQPFTRKPNDLSVAFSTADGLKYLGHLPAGERRMSYDQAGCSIVLDLSSTKAHVTQQGTCAELLGNAADVSGDWARY
jgi:hypothetical protein